MSGRLPEGCTFSGHVGGYTVQVWLARDQEVPVYYGVVLDTAREQVRTSSLFMDPLGAEAWAIEAAHDLLEPPR